MAYTKANNKIIDYDFESIIKQIAKVCGNEIAYHAIISLDEDGFSLYHSAKQLTKINIYEHFYAEDCQGLFEDMNGFDLKRYIEAAKFGQCEYALNGCYELLTRFTINYSADDYKKYENELFALAIENMFNQKINLTSEKILAIETNLNSLKAGTFKYTKLHPAVKTTYTLRPECVTDKSSEDDDLEL